MVYNGKSYGSGPPLGNPTSWCWPWEVSPWFRPKKYVQTYVACVLFCACQNLYPKFLPNEWHEISHVVTTIINHSQSWVVYDIVSTTLIGKDGQKCMKYHLQPGDKCCCDMLTGIPETKTGSYSISHEVGQPGWRCFLDIGRPMSPKHVEQNNRQTVLVGGLNPSEKY